MSRPYKETVTDQYVVRDFSNDTPALEFVWHRDKEDRIVQALHNTDCLLYTSPSPRD